MFQRYFKAIQDKYLTTKEFTEHTFRTALENLLNDFKDETIKRKLTVIHEVTQQGKHGRPDFKVVNNENIPIGYIETKKIGENLDNTLSSDQLDKYRSLSPNIILTDYLRFIIIKDGKPIDEITLFTKHQLENKRFAIDELKTQSLAKIFTIFFEHAPEPISNPKDLALKLSEKAKYLRTFCFDELNNDVQTKIDGLYETFKDSLLPDLTKEYFSDIYAQTITYGLFLALLNCEQTKDLSVRSAFDFIPDTFPLIKELFHELERFPASIQWVIDEILAILKCVDLEALMEWFSFTHDKKKGFSDPYIYFYEDFLENYDKNQKEITGVFYTPVPIVSFIVRSVEKILKNDFQINDGYIGNEVTVLDFSCGTGTFLLDVFKHAIEEAKRKLSKNEDKETIKKEVNEHMVKRFFGFELMVAPYVIAHLKISQYLKEQGYELQDRLNIFLTNTLKNEEVKEQSLFPILSKEGEKANRIKNKDILVVLGNPPYSVSSNNKTGYIAENKIDDYKPTDEKKINLDDDYIKFIRFANLKIEKINRGVVAIITNNSFLNGITHRKMRGKLLKDFDTIHILNLHGNSRIKETCPDGSSDENVFDIMQGVSIAIFSKIGLKERCKVFSSDVQGKRTEKYNLLEENDIESISWEELKIDEFNKLFRKTRWSNRFLDDLNFFVPIRSANILNYGEFWGIKDIFSVGSVGIETKRDDLTIQFDNEAVSKILYDFGHTNESEFKIKYNLDDSKGWKFADAKKVIEKYKYSPKYITSIYYRPLDLRKTYYLPENGFMGRPRYEVMRHHQKNNLALITTRLVNQEPFAHVIISEFISEKILLSSKTSVSAYSFPLYLYKNEDEFDIFEEKDKTPNFTEIFTQFMESHFHDNDNIIPEEILGYTYAILHSPTYRLKYQEFLKIDFPRVPFTEDEGLFKKLAKIGQELIEHHLMHIGYESNISSMEGSGTNYKVEKVEYKDGKVCINQDRFFDGITATVWDFHIGGYQVLDKWLKERKKHETTLSSEDIKHFIKIVNVLDSTTKIMQKIDGLTKEWV